jgi:transposase
MSTSILYHGFGLVGYDYVRTQYEGRNITFTIRHKREKLRCPVCRGREVMMRGTTKRRFRWNSGDIILNYRRLKEQYFCR